MVFVTHNTSFYNIMSIVSVIYEYCLKGEGTVRWHWIPFPSNPSPFVLQSGPFTIFIAKEIQQ